MVGASITIPLKEQMIKYVDILSDDVIKIGALNTLTKTKNCKIKGDNTDWIAIYDIIRDHNFKDNINVYVIGTGGSACSVCYAINKLEYNLFIRGRSNNKIEYFINNFNANTNIDNNFINIIIICIPGDIEIDLSNHTECELIIEMAYNPIMKRIYPKQAKIINGIQVLYKQAHYQNKLWIENNVFNSV